jgi:hypothetical protein
VETKWYHDVTVTGVNHKFPLTTTISTVLW